MDGWLCLSRKTGESVVIGEGEDTVEVKVLEFGPGKVRLGFRANRRVSIDRREVRDAKVMAEHTRRAGT